MNQRFVSHSVPWVLATLVVAALAAPARADLRFDPPQLDLGAVKAGQVLLHKVKVVNAGAGPLTVLEVKGSCGCLRPTLEPATLAPGQEGVLMLTVNTLSSNPGAQVYRVTLRCLDGAQPNDEAFTVRANVLPQILVPP